MLWLETVMPNSLRFKIRNRPMGASGPARECRFVAASLSTEQARTDAAQTPELDPDPERDRQRENEAGGRRSLSDRRNNTHQKAAT
jgi:hypothetical protein